MDSSWNSRENHKIIYSSYLLGWRHNSCSPLSLLHILQQLLYKPFTNFPFSASVMDTNCSIRSVVVVVSSNSDIPYHKSHREFWPTAAVDYYTSLDYWEQHFDSYYIAINNLLEDLQLIGNLLNLVIVILASITFVDILVVAIDFLLLGSWWAIT